MRETITMVTATIIATITIITGMSVELYMYSIWYMRYECDYVGISKNTMQYNTQYTLSV